MFQAETSTRSDFPQTAGDVSVAARRPLHAVADVRESTPSLFTSEIRSDEYSDVVLSLYERSGVGLAILDPTLRVRSVNSAFSTQCGRYPDDIRERSFAEFLHPSVRQHVLRQFGRLVQEHHAPVISRSIAMWFHDTAVSGKLAAFPVRDESGRVKMIMAQFTPEEPADDRQELVGSQRKLTALTAKVLEGVAAGDPTVRLAAKLFLSRQGVEYHVSILLRQFKVPNRTALAAKAYSMGMFSIGCWPPKILPEYIRPDRQGAERTRGARQDGA
ncbi:helix-turn-helix transcriptional regulator [Streptomyces sp. NPDC001478]